MVLTKMFTTTIFRVVQGPRAQAIKITTKKSKTWCMKLLGYMLCVTEDSNLRIACSRPIILKGTIIATFENAAFALKVIER